MAEQDIIFEVDVDELIEDVVTAARLLLAIGRERLIAVAGGYLMADDPALAAELSGLTLDELALRSAGRALVCQELDELTDAARAALDEMAPEQQLAAVRERTPIVETRPGKIDKCEVTFAGGVVVAEYLEGEKVRL